MHDVIAVHCLTNFHLRLAFGDGAKGVVDMRPFIEQGGVFAPLSKPAYFAKVAVNSDIGTICWPNGADVCPDVLYSLATGKDLPDWAEEASVGKER